MASGLTLQDIIAVVNSIVTTTLENTDSGEIFQIPNTLLSSEVIAKFGAATPSEWMDLKKALLENHFQIGPQTPNTEKIAKINLAHFLATMQTFKSLMSRTETMYTKFPPTTEAGKRFINSSIRLAELVIISFQHNKVPYFSGVIPGFAGPPAPFCHSWLTNTYSAMDTKSCLDPESFHYFHKDFDGGWCGSDKQKSGAHRLWSQYEKPDFPKNKPFDEVRHSLFASYFFS